MYEFFFLFNKLTRNSLINADIKYLKLIKNKLRLLKKEWRNKK